MPPLSTSSSLEYYTNLRCTTPTTGVSKTPRSAGPGGPYPVVYFHPNYRHINGDADDRLWSLLSSLELIRRANSVLSETGTTRRRRRRRVELNLF